MSEEFVEIPKSKLAALEGISKLNNELWNDPVHGMKIKEIVKEKYPNANIPEVDVLRSSRKAEEDILSKVEATKKETLERIEAFEKSQKEREESATKKREEDNFAAEVESTRNKYKLTAEGMEKVFARMKEKNNPDVEAAAAWVTDHEIKATPITNSSADPTFNPYGSRGEDKAWELLNRNPFDGKFAEQEINKITNDFANGRAHLYGTNGMGGEL